MFAIFESLERIQSGLKPSDEDPSARSKSGSWQATLALTPSPCFRLIRRNAICLVVRSTSE